MRNQRAFTLMETLLAVSLSSLLGLVLWRMTATGAKATLQTDLRIRSDVTLRTAMDKIEANMLNANTFNVAVGTEVIFTADLNTDPDYQPSGDLDADGLLNLDDPDDDGDATLIQPPTAQWKIGYDLKDDDDDGDNQVDMLWRIYLTTRPGVANNTLYRDYSKNGQAWGQHVETMVTHVVSSAVFTYYGSENDLLSPGATNYDINNNGLITADEIDSPTNGGNGNGRIDTTAEKNSIVSVAVAVDRDSNQDGKLDSYLSTEIMPPPLYLKRRP